MEKTVENAVVSLTRVESALRALTSGGDGSDALTWIQCNIEIIADEIRRTLETLDAGGTEAG